MPGESKASIREGMRSPTRCAPSIQWSRGEVRAVRLVGVSVLLVNTFALAFAGEVLGLFYLLAAVLATEFQPVELLISERFVFNRDRQKSCACSAARCSTQ